MVVRRARGRITGAAVVKGGDVALYVRAGLHFTVIDDRMTAAADDTTEICGVRLLGNDNTTYLTIINLYRPPIRTTDDEREDLFDPAVLPTDSKTLLVGDVNAHHPMWDAACETPDEVGERIAGWLDAGEWRPLNTGSPTFTSYRSGSHSAPDLAACSAALARRACWSTGPDLGSDHLPMVIEVRATAARPQRIRKARWAHHKADWRAFQDDCEAALTGAEPARSAQEAATRLTRAIQQAAVRHIPKGARADPATVGPAPRSAGGRPSSPRSKKGGSARSPREQRTVDTGQTTCRQGRGESHERAVPLLRLNHPEPTSQSR